MNRFVLFDVCKKGIKFDESEKHTQEFTPFINIRWKVLKLISINVMKNSVKLTKKETKNFILDIEGRFDNENILVDYQVSVSREFQSFFTVKQTDEKDIEKSFKNSSLISLNMK